MFTSFINDQYRRFRMWRERRSAIRQLAALDDHLLRDIGIERSGIEVAVNGPVSTAVGDRLRHPIHHAPDLIDVAPFRARRPAGRPSPAV